MREHGQGDVPVPGVAAADLADRLGHTNFTLLGCGDTNNKPPDQSFTGDDTFWIIFRAPRAACLSSRSQRQGPLHGRA